MTPAAGAALTFEQQFQELLAIREPSALDQAIRAYFLRCVEAQNVEAIGALSRPELLGRVHQLQLTDALIAVEGTAKYQFAIHILRFGFLRMDQVERLFLSEVQKGRYDGVLQITRARLPMHNHVIFQALLKALEQNYGGIVCLLIHYYQTTFKSEIQERLRPYIQRAVADHDIFALHRYLCLEGLVLIDFKNCSGLKEHTLHFLDFELSCLHPGLQQEIQPVIDRVKRVFRSSEAVVNMADVMDGYAMLHHRVLQVAYQLRSLQPGTETASRLEVIFRSITRIRAILGLGMAVFVLEKGMASNMNWTISDPIFALTTACLLHDLPVIEKLIASDNYLKAQISFPFDIACRKERWDVAQALINLSSRMVPRQFCDMVQSAGRSQRPQLVLEIISDAMRKRKKEELNAFFADPSLTHYLQAPSGEVSVGIEALSHLHFELVPVPQAYQCAYRQLDESQTSLRASLAAVDRYTQAIQARFEQCSTPEEKTLYRNHPNRLCASLPEYQELTSCIQRGAVGRLIERMALPRAHRECFLARDLPSQRAELLRRSFYLGLAIDKAELAQADRQTLEASYDHVATIFTTYAERFRTRWLSTPHVEGVPHPILALAHYRNWLKQLITQLTYIEDQFSRQEPIDQENIVMDILSSMKACSSRLQAHVHQMFHQLVHAQAQDPLIALFLQHIESEVERVKAVMLQDLTLEARADSHVHNLFESALGAYTTRQHTPDASLSQKKQEGVLRQFLKAYDLERVLISIQKELKTMPALMSMMEQRFVQMKQDTDWEEILRQAEQLLSLQSKQQLAPSEAALLSQLTDFFHPALDVFERERAQASAESRLGPALAPYRDRLLENHHKRKNAASALSASTRPLKRQRQDREEIVWDQLLAMCSKFFQLQTAASTHPIQKANLAQMQELLEKQGVLPLLAAVADRHDRASIDAALKPIYATYVPKALAALQEMEEEEEGIMVQAAQLPRDADGFVTLSTIASVMQNVGLLHRWLCV